MQTIESLLETELLIDGLVMKANEMPIDKQVEYLIDEHFDVFRSDESKLWRMQNLYHIITKDGEKALFRFNEAQFDFVTKYILPGYQKLIILKARQLGFTTLAALWFLDEVIFHPNREALQIAHTQKDAGELFNRKIKYAIRNFFPAMKDLVGMSADTKTTVEFSYGDGSRSKFNVSNSGRSGTFHYLHISELAKLSKLYPARADEVVTGTLPSVPKNDKTLVMIESTAEGVTGLFYDMYMQSYKRRDVITPIHTVAEYKPVFYNWTWDKDQIRQATRNGCIPIKDMEESEIDWADFKLEHNLTDEEITYYYIKWIEAGRDINKLNQEFPTTEMEAFISTGANFFSTKKIFKELEKLELGETNYQTYAYENKLFVEHGSDYSDKFEGLVVFEEPEPGRHYVIGGDVAEGLMSGDWSTCAVVGMDKKIKAVYRGHVDPDEYTDIIELLGKKYNTALLAVEFNKDGNWVNTELNLRNYPNMYFRTQFDDITQTVSKNYGWITNKKTRDVALGELKSHFNSCAEFPYKIILDEMVNFVRDKRGKPQAQSGKHDDCFVKGTKIQTENGTKNIEDIKIGDTVLTRGGPRKVLNIRSSYKKVVKNIGLVGTPNHPIITPYGEIDLTNVVDSDTLYIWNTLKQKIEKLSFTTIKNTTDTQTQKEDNTDFIFGDMINGKNRLFHYIGKYGLIILEKYQKVLLYTIKTITSLIIILKIWNASLRHNTQKNIWLTQNGKNFLERLGGSSQRELLDNLRNGEKDQKTKTYILNLQKKAILKKLKEKLNVLLVKTCLNLVLLMLYTVLRFVEIMLITTNVLKIRKVYNLHIEEHNEYFANNILVHNCIMATSIAFGVLQGKVENTQEKKNVTFSDLIWRKA